MAGGQQGTFVQVYEGLVSSGLLARLSGSAFKVLTTLSLAAAPLGSGPACARAGSRTAAFFRDLLARGVLTPADRGRLFCCLPHRDLARRAGLGKNTVTRATSELQALGLVEKRVVRRPDGTRYNLFFLLPASYIDKFNTHRAQIPNIQSPIPNPHAPLPKTGTVPPPGTNYIPNNTTTPPPPRGRKVDNKVRATQTSDVLPRRSSANRRQASDGGQVRARGANIGSLQGVDNKLDAPALLSHFARRKGLARYRPTAHDRHKVDLLRQRGCTQAQVLAAIDLAFDRRPADAPPIRMFSYCATIALAGPPANPSAATAAPPIPDARAPIPNPQSPIYQFPNLPTSQFTVLPSSILTLYQEEIGPLSPLVLRELAPLVAVHPDLDEWDAAFREAIRANVRRLSYVQAVLEGRAARGAAGPSANPGGKSGQDRMPGKESRDRRDAARGRDVRHRHNRPADVGHRPFDAEAIVAGRQPFNWSTCTGEELLAVQRAAAAVEPLDPALGADHD